MKKIRLINKIAPCILAMSLITVSAGCGEKKADDKKTISVIAKSKSMYWEVVNAGAGAAGEELGYEIKYAAPESEKEIDKQVEMINQAKNDKVDAMVVAPINGDYMNEAMQSAIDAGIAVITIDSKCTIENMPYIGTDNNAAGEIGGREALNMLDQSKKVGIVAVSNESEVSASRASGFEKVLSENPEVTVVETKYCNSDKELAKQQAAELIEDYPDLEMIYGVNQTTTLAICETVSEKNLAGKIKVVGFDAAEPEIEFINNGVLTGTIVQNPYNIGYLGVKNACKIADGESVSTFVDTGVTFVNSENINDSTIQLLIYPLGKK